jgi:hypothetical protein
LNGYKKVQRLKYEERDMSHDAQQNGAARYWKLSRGKRKLARTRNGKIAEYERYFPSVVLCIDYYLFNILTTEMLTRFSFI